MTNKIYDSFNDIKASEEIRSSTLRFLHTQRKGNGSHAVFFSWKRPFAAVCAACLLFFGVGAYCATQIPVSYISIDVNPSVELTLNRIDRVISAAAYNKDGEIILKGVQVKGQYYTEALDNIIGSPAMQPYLTDGSELVFTVASNDGKKQSAILSGVENSSGYREHYGKSHAADTSFISEAHGYDLSFGKYAAYLMLSQYDSTITAEDCRNMSMSEIHHQIVSHENYNQQSNSSESLGSYQDDTEDYSQQQGSSESLGSYQDDAEDYSQQQGSSESLDFYQHDAEDYNQHQGGYESFDFYQDDAEDYNQHQGGYEIHIRQDSYENSQQPNGYGYGYGNHGISGGHHGE